MAKRIATITGTALVPGVSRNSRLYTREAIAKAVARGQARIAADDMPLTMLTHHEAGDSSTHVVGRITGLTLAEDGSARFTADLADTAHGRDIASLVDPRDGKPFLRGVSIRGAWIGKPRTEDMDGKQVETADDLELDGLDFTKRPGVAGAAVDGFEPVAESAADGRPRIFESVPEALVAEEVAEAADPKKPYGDVPYADPGYQADKKKRYPIGSRDTAKAAWSYVNMPKNAKAYTPAQLKRIKQRIKGALKKFGVQIATEGWLIDTVGYVIESTLAEHYADYDLTPQGSFCINLSNGPLNISISSYRVDPADLDLIGRAAMSAACDALAAIDPDADGDMDVPGADAEDTDDDRMETEAPAASIAEAEAVPAADEVAEAAPQVSPASGAGDASPNAAPDPAADPHTETEEAAVSEPTTQAVEATPAAPTAPSSITLTGEQFQQLLDAVRPAPAAPPAESAPPAPVAEATPAAPAAPAAPTAPTETEDQRIARLVAEQVAAAKTAMIQELVESGRGPARKGLVSSLSEHGLDGGGELNEHGVPASWPNKPLHEYTAAERSKYFGPVLQDNFLGDKAVY